MGTYTQTNGSATTNGRGVLRCLLGKRLDLAAAAVLGQRPLVPSIEQAVRDFRVSRRELVERIKLHRALEENGNGHAVAVEDEDHTAPEFEEPQTVDTEFVRSIVHTLQNATLAERTEIARGLGCDWAWDHLVVPCMRASSNG